MSCTRRGFLKTIGAAMLGLGLTRLDAVRGLAASSTGGPGTFVGGPTSGRYSVEALRARAVAAAQQIGDRALAAELREVCCWAPAMARVRARPLGRQWRGARWFFQGFPGGDQLAEVLLYANNTSWGGPRFRFDPEGLLDAHYRLLERSQRGLRTEVVTPGAVNGVLEEAQLDLMLDRATGERLSRATDRSEPMWAALSILSGAILDPTEELSRRLVPRLSLTRASHRALARVAGVRYSQAVLGAAQRAVWSDLLNDRNAALPLVQLSAAGYVPLGEADGRFFLLRLEEGRRLTGYRTGSV